MPVEQDVFVSHSNAGKAMTRALVKIIVIGSPSVE